MTSVPSRLALLGGDRRILRRRAEQAIERLITLLDALDGDTDLEAAGDDEPSADAEPGFGWTEIEARYGRHFVGVDEGEVDDAD